MNIPVVKSRFLYKGKIRIISKFLLLIPIGFSDELEILRVR